MNMGIYCVSKMRLAWTAKNTSSAKYVRRNVRNPYRNITYFLRGADQDKKYMPESVLNRLSRSTLEFFFHKHGAKISSPFYFKNITNRRNVFEIAYPNKIDLNNSEQCRSMLEEIYHGDITNSILGSIEGKSYRPFDEPLDYLNTPAVKFLNEILAKMASKAYTENFHIPQKNHLQWGINQMKKYTSHKKYGAVSKKSILKVIDNGYFDTSIDNLGWKKNDLKTAIELLWV